MNHTAPQHPPSASQDSTHPTAPLLSSTKVTTKTRALPHWVAVLSGCVIFLFSGSLYLSSSLKAEMVRASQGSTRSAADEILFVTDTTTLKLLSLGYRQAAADIIWLRSIQYFVTHLLSDRRYPWLEHFINQIIELDPRFRQVYLWAGSCILYGGEITPDTVRASNRIYESALKSFPNDYEPAYRLGMNYYSELKVDDPEEHKRNQRLGLAYFERAAQSPDAPPIVLELIRGIARKMSRDDILLYALSDELARTEDRERREQIAARIDQLRERLTTQRDVSETSNIWLRDRAAHLRSRQMYESQRHEVRMYLSPLEYEMIFSKPHMPIAWRTLSGLDTELPQHTLDEERRETPHASPSAP